MPQPIPPPDPSSESARALSPPPVVRSCPACGAELRGRQKACSGKCRATLSRRRRADSVTSREQRMRDLVKVLAREAGLCAEDFET